MARKKRSPKDMETLELLGTLAESEPGGEAWSDAFRKLLTGGPDPWPLWSECSLELGSAVRALLTGRTARWESFKHRIDQGDDPEVVHAAVLTMVMTRRHADPGNCADETSDLIVH